MLVAGSPSEAFVSGDGCEMVGKERAEDGDDELRLAGLEGGLSHECAEFFKRRAAWDFGWHGVLHKDAMIIRVTR